MFVSLAWDLTHSLFCITTILHNKTCCNVLSTPYHASYAAHAWLLSPFPSLLSPPSSTAPPAVQYSPDTLRSSLPSPSLHTASNAPSPPLPSILRSFYSARVGSTRALPLTVCVRTAVAVFNPPLPWWRSRRHRQSPARGGIHLPPPLPRRLRGLI